MTEDQFVEEIKNAVERHISRDPSICEKDRNWETRNVAKTLSSRLRMWLPLVPEVGDEDDREKTCAGCGNKWHHDSVWCPECALKRAVDYATSTAEDKQ